MYQEDLGRSTEIVLTQRNRVRQAGDGAATPRARQTASGSASRAAAGALSVGNAMGAALTNRRLLGPAESGLLMKVSALALIVAVVAFLWPLLLTIPLGILAAWFGVSLLMKAWSLRQQRAVAPAPVERPERSANDD